MSVQVSTPWSAKVDEVLADGLWHPLKLVIDEAMFAVPPAIAFWEGERGRTRGRVVPRQHGDDNTAIDTGARAKVYRSIIGRARHGTIERRDVNGVAEIRKRPS